MQRLQILKCQISSQKDKPLKGKTIVITGASRGIGLAIGLRCAQDGANVAILAKTVTPQPNLPGSHSLIKELFILQLKKLRKQEAKLWPSHATFGMKKVFRKAFRKW